MYSFTCIFILNSQRSDSWLSSFFTQIVPHGIQPVFDVWEDLETLLYAGLQ